MLVGIDGADEEGVEKVGNIIWEWGDKGEEFKYWLWGLFFVWIIGFGCFIVVELGSFIEMLVSLLEMFFELVFSFVVYNSFLVFFKWFVRLRELFVVVFG